MDKSIDRLYTGHRDRYTTTLMDAFFCPSCHEMWWSHSVFSNLWCTKWAKWGSASSPCGGSTSNSAGLALVSLAPRTVAAQGYSGPPSARQSAVSELSMYNILCVKYADMVHDSSVILWCSLLDLVCCSHLSCARDCFLTLRKDTMAKKAIAMAMLQGAQVLAMAWFDYFRGILLSRPVLERRSILAQQCAKGEGPPSEALCVLLYERIS